MKQSFSLVLAVAIVSIVVSCGSDSSRSSRNGDAAPDRSGSDSSSEANGSGLWDMLARSEQDKARRQVYEKEREIRLRAQLEKGMAQLPAEQRDNMIRWWREFIELKPEWIEHRHLWRAYGNDAKEILAENLIIAMVRSYSKNNGPVYKRARSELYDLADVATPYMVSGLADGRGDSVTRTHCVEMLGWYGAKAVSAISDAYSDAGRDARLDLLRAIKAMGPLGAPESISFLNRALSREDDFRLRLTAIQALGASEDLRSIPALIDCLDDDDLSVRKFSAGTLGHFRTDEAILALIETLEKSERRMLPDNRESEVVVNCIHSLRTMTGESYRRGAQWRRWWNRR
ncbi:MAG: hypothetical protein ACI97A_004216 [Planctomycetota bacterium]|jgi:hypothetical protein